MGCALEHPYQAGRHDDGAPLRPGGCELTLRALNLADFASGERVLDLGCGVGVATRLLQRHGCTAIGLDLALKRLSLARRDEPALAMVAGDAAQLPFAAESLGGILAECSLSLTGFSPTVLAECHRVLRRGGRLAVTDLYTRADNGQRPALPGCLGGMAARAGILAALTEAGFIIQCWEDHSDRLKSFVAQLIFTGGGAEALWSGDGPDYAVALRASRPGYFLLVARKND